MNKEFIPYKQALELKEMGYGEECLDSYDKASKKLNTDMETWGEYYAESESLKIPAPLYQQAFRWFRDKKLIDGSVSRHGESDGGYSYRWDIIHEYGVYEERHFKKGYKTYEEAELACLKQLIEIVKNK